MFLGSPQYVATTPYVYLYCTADIPQRFLNEVHAYYLLHDGGVGLPLLVGIYSTETHPFGLVYEHMDGLDVKQHLQKEPNVERLKLVLASLNVLS